MVFGGTICPYFSETIKKSHTNAESYITKNPSMQYSNPYSNPYSNHYSKILESGLESANENTLNSQNSEIITDSKDYENYGSKMSSEYTRLGFIGDNI